MSVKKLDELKQIWETKGFEIQSYEERSDNGNLLELTLYVKPLKWQNSCFVNNWSDIKAAASSQDFYVMPITDLNFRGEMVLCLVDNQSIYDMNEKFQAIIDVIEQSYWFVQGDRELNKICSQAIILREKISLVQREVKLMWTNTPYVRLFNNKTTHPEWIEYKEKLIEWVAEVAYCEKVTPVALDLMQEIQEAYVFDF